MEGIIRTTRSLPVIGALTALVLGTAGVPPAAAATPTDVFIPVCDLFEGGETVVPAGPVRAVLGGWGVGTKGALVHWLKSQQSSLTVRYSDGTRVTRDLTTRWSDPERGDGKFWFSIAPVVRLHDLEAGETARVTFTFSWTKPTLDSFFDGEHPVLSKGGDITSTCLITAE